ncbi:MAG: hypothetical protein HYV35_03445 [Lentisphaerae bacterium]|nr:hypothetical protein [Lentisphaerota bacterium]
MSANGTSGSGSGYYGGGSGGGIYLTCRTFIGNTNGLLRANGGAGNRYGGGGGRIAVWRMYDNSAGAVSNYVNAGTGPSGTGAVGTVVWRWLPAPGTIVSFR